MSLDNLGLSDLAKNFVSKKEDELRQQLGWLIDRGILVIHQTQEQYDLKKQDDGGYKFTVSQRLGLHVEAERYIEKLESKLEKLMAVVEAAKPILDGHERMDCAYFSVPKHDMDALRKTLEELEKE